LAAQGKMSLWGVIAAGTFGSWLGSAITYGVARGLEQNVGKGSTGRAQRMGSCAA
jgi:membrane protein DedA with SNARE-associated domain